MVVALLGFGGLALPCGPASADPAGAGDQIASARVAGTTGSGDTITGLPGTLLPAPAHGRQAIRRLGDDLPIAAERSDLTSSQLRSLLREDDTAWMDRRGAVHFIDPAPPTQALRPRSRTDRAAAVAPLDQTFALHSNPGADLTILLDVDGADVSGTAWNYSYGVTPGAQPAWDPAGDGPGFSDSERLQVQQVWASVAEDYAPFDVDVTTEDLGPDQLLRSSDADTVYGTRVLITPSDDPFAKICQRSCGGIAYLSVFDSVGGYMQPAWVFPQALGNDAKNVAEAASHESGHNLGLLHDGTSGEGYYPGHGAWAPIMGVGYYRPLVEWSQGSYPDANNQEDDLAIIGSYVGLRADEAFGSIDSPSVLPDGPATIGTPADVDTYLLGSCTPGSTVSVDPAAVAPDLDVRASLFDSTGHERVVGDPPSAMVDQSTASGLGASLTVPADGDGWVLRIEGVGQGSWASSGYDDYGSLGTYTVSAPSCDGALVDGVPSAPTGVGAGVDGETSLTLTWSAPASSGSGPVTGYRVTRSGSATSQLLPADARSHSFTGLTAGTTYELSVRAVNATGAGPSVTVSATTTSSTPAAPSAPQDLAGSYNRNTGRLEVSWSEPASSGTSPISGYEVYLDGVDLGQLGAASRGAVVSRNGGFSDGAYVVGVAAVNAVGMSPTAEVTITVEDPTASVPTAPLNVTGTYNRDLGRFEAYWSAPASSGSSPITGYEIYLNGVDLGQLGATSRGVYISRPGGYPDGTYVVGIAAVNAVGSSPVAEVTIEIGPTAPSAPTGVAARPDDHRADVTWHAAAANGSALTGYTVHLTTDNEPERTVDVDGVTTSASVPGLTNGTTYTVTVTATNAVGTSTPSTPVTVVPDVPDVNDPTARSFASADRIVDPFFHTPDVTLRVRLSDDRGIAGQPTIHLGTDNGDEWYDGSGWRSSLSAGLTLARGDRHDGVWVASLSLPGFAPTGTWSAWVDAADAWGNTVTNARGDHTVLTVVNDLHLGSTPAAPTGVTATPGHGRVRVSWQAPAGTVTDYTVWVSPGVASVVVDGTHRSVVVDGLEDGSDYSFTVVAGNSVGESDESVASPTVTPTAVPTQPTDVQAQRADGGALVTWRSGYLDADIDSFVVTASASGVADRSVSVAGDQLQAHLDGLTNGASYAVTVTARSARGDSEASAPATVVPAGAPGRVAKPSAARGDGSATVNWVAPSANGSAITGYTVTASPGGATATVGGDQTSTEITGLTNGTAYTFTVVATNDVGDGTTSDPSDQVVPAGVPSRVDRVTAVRGDRSATVNWVAPSANGSAITGYTVTASPGGATVTVGGGQTSAQVTGLTNGTAYTFRVVATNDVGSSAAGSPSNRVTPATVPGRVSKPTAVVSGHTATIRWKPAAANGAPVTGYTITSNHGVGMSVPGSKLSVRLGGLARGVHQFVVRAQNAVGVGPASAALTVRIR